MRGVGVGEFDLRLGRVMENLNWSGLVEYTCLFIFVICFRAKKKKEKRIPPLRANDTSRERNITRFSSCFSGMYKVSLFALMCLEFALTASLDTLNCRLV